MILPAEINFTYVLISGDNSPFGFPGSGLINYNAGTKEITWPNLYTS